MNDIPTIVPDPASRYFDNYLNCQINASIPEKQRSWYDKRLEKFIKARNGRKIKDLSAAETHQYFDMKGRNNRLAGWQFLQYIDAIRILY